MSGGNNRTESPGDSNPYAAPRTSSVISRADRSASENNYWPLYLWIWLSFFGTLVLDRPLPLFVELPWNHILLWCVFCGASAYRKMLPRWVAFLTLLAGACISPEALREFFIRAPWENAAIVVAIYGFAAAWGVLAWSSIRTKRGKIAIAYLFGALPGVVIGPVIANVLAWFLIRWVIGARGGGNSRRHGSIRERYDRIPREPM